MPSVEELLHPISETAPCGEDLSNDVALQELETLARGKPETQFSAAEPPNWKQVAKAGLDLFARSKDLRVALLLTLAWLELEGLTGFCRGLGLIAGLMETFWATAHPQLDPADNNDPLQRMNIVASLAMPVGTFGDPYRMLERLRSVPLTDSAQMGRITWSDLLGADASGQPGTGGGKHTPAQIDAAFRDTSQGFLAATFQAATTALDLAKHLDVYLTGVVGAGDAPDLEPLTGELALLQKRLSPYAAGAGDGVKRLGGMTAGTRAPASAEAGAAGALDATGEIQSRADIVRLLDKICDYYSRQEPSSPVPLLLKRAARLAAMDFMEIMADLTPESIAQIRTITGEPAGPAE
ncbi:MAG TPA: type VI secretion system protein TssA [Chthoniobacterales bacterium]